MTDLAFQLHADDGHAIAVYHWPTPSARGVVHILHGMAEHGGRYARLADALNNAGWSVVAHDHRGHGLSVHDEQDRGHYDDEDGWQKVSGDVSAVQGWISTQYPGMPRVLMGHSMGTFIAMSWALEHAAEIDGLILSSTDLKPRWFYRFMRMILAVEKWRLGARGKSALVQSLTFSSFAKKMPDRDTDFDWLSRDAEEVKKYIADPLCGHECTMQLWCDLIDGLSAVSHNTGLATIDAQLPLYIFYGDNDPMSDFGKGPEYMEKILRKHRPEKLTIKKYVGGRHELLNDVNRDEISQSISDWLNQHITRR
ncbi:MAG: alpha/beta hydrolase [Alcanivoracaceae bacterium]|nr:alpha/beta hydrolase [Alcanivoracaceae bacterium]